MASPRTVGPEGPSPATPAVVAESWTVLQTPTQCAAGFTLAGGVIDVREWDTLGLFFDIDAAHANDRLCVKVKVSNEAAAPLATDDVWHLPTADDGIAAGAGGGAVATGADETLLPADWAVVTLRQVEYRFSQMGDAANELRPVARFDVRLYRWAIVEVADNGGGTRCTVGIKYARGC